MLLSPGRLHVAKSYAWVMQEGSTRLWMNGKSSPHSLQPATSALPQGLKAQGWLIMKHHAASPGGLHLPVCLGTKTKR